MQAGRLRPQAKLKPQAKFAAGPTPQPPRLPPPQRRVQADDDDDDYEKAPAPPSRPPPLRQMVEAYFSDANLKTDRHLREIISESPGGWVDIGVVLELKRVRALKAKREETLRVLRDSPLFELWHDPVDGSAAVRRAKGRPLPKFEGARAAMPRQEPVVPDEEAVPPDEEAAPPAPPDEAPADEEAQEGAGEDVAAAPAKRRRCISAEVKPGARFVGKIASFHQGLGMGFVNCRPTFEVYGKDLALDRVAMKQFMVGDCVAFGLFVDPDFGTPKAVELEAADEADLDFCVAEAPEPARTAAVKATKTAAAKAPASRAAKLASARAARAAAPKPPAGGLAGMRFVGEVLSVDEATGDGEISCPETFAALGCNVECLGEELAGFDPGDRVSFALRAAKAVDLMAEAE